MAKDRMTLDDIEMVKRIVRSEVKELADAVDETSLGNYKTLGTTIDRASHNILKLQAQITALKEVLIAKGAVSRQALHEREERELHKLERMTQPQEEATHQGN